MISIHPKEIIFVDIFSFRYYPTLASLQFQNCSIRLLIVLYFLASMIYKSWFNNSSTHGLIFLLKYLRSKKSYSWLLVYNSIKNFVHYSFVGYVSGELTIRLLYDSIYINCKRGKKISHIPYRAIEQYSYKADRKKKCFIRDLKQNTENINSDNSGCWKQIRRYCNMIYRYDPNFRYTTIAVCIYTLAYLFLFHLTGAIVLLYSERQNGYIQYIEKFFEVMLDISRI